MMHGKSHTSKAKKKKSNIDVDDVDTKTLIQEAHTTIGQTVSLREEAHIQRIICHNKHKHDIIIKYI